ncbi:MAG: histidine phosphatase family protein [Bacilli bacterium]
MCVRHPTSRCHKKRAIRTFQSWHGAYLSGFNNPEFEDWGRAMNRIVDCIQGILSEANGSSEAVVSHGRILSVLFSHLLSNIG